MHLSPISTTFDANSTPMVVFDSKLNSFLVNLDMIFDLPTPESPTRTSLSWKSDSSFFFVVMDIKGKDYKLNRLIGLSIGCIIITS